jgi:hypothetical protein
MELFDAAAAAAAITGAVGIVYAVWCCCCYNATCFAVSNSAPIFATDNPA